MPETNATQQNQGGQQLTSPKEETIKDRKAEDIKGLVFKFRIIRWVLFTVMVFCLGVIFIMPKISSFQSRISFGSAWNILVISIILWYGSHCLKFVMAWENAPVFRFGKLLQTIVPGVGWIWYGLDKIAFVRMDQREGELRDLSLLCSNEGRKLEVTVKTFFVYRVKNAASFIVNASKGVELLCNMIEAGIGSVVGSNEFDVLVEHRDMLTERLKKIINNRISNPDEAPGVADLGFRLSEEALKPESITERKAFLEVPPVLENEKKGWGLEVLQIRIQDIDPQREVLETMQGVIKAQNQAQAKIEEANGQAQARKTLAKVKKFEMEQEAAGAGAMIAKQGEAYAGPGGEKVYGVEVSKTIKQGDKTFVMSLGGGQDEALLTKTVGALAGGISILKGDKKE